MISRRKFIRWVGAISGLFLGSRGAMSRSFFSRLSSPSVSPDGDVSRFVKIAIGTGGHGHCYPGPTVPFGMVQLSPDTYNFGWDRCSGYHYSDTSIMGFSHTHPSGTGAGELFDFLV